MKKLSFYLLSISILASCLFFSSCGGDSDEDPAPIATPTNPATGGSGGGGSSADTTGPSVNTTNPEDGETDVAVGITIQVNFSEPIDINSVSNTSLILSGGTSNSIATVVTVSNSTGLMTIDPNNDLQEGTEYLLRLSGLTDKAGNAMPNDYATRFTTLTNDFVNVTSNTASNITSSSATLSGSTEANISLAEKGFVYNAGSGTPTTSNTKVIITGSGSTFERSIDGLSSNTLYTFRAYAISSLGTTYGSNQTFTTLDVPIVQTLEADGVINRSGFINGSIDTNGQTLTRYGFVWARKDDGTTAPIPDISNQTNVSTTGNVSNFTAEIKNLIPLYTSISFRSFAEMEDGTIIYGATKYFRTLAIGGAQAKIISLRYSSMNSRDIIGSMTEYRINPVEWSEFPDGGSRVDFTRTNSDTWSVYLTKKTDSNFNYQIDTYDGIIYRTYSNGTKQAVYRIREMYENREWK